ncbi:MULTISPECIES: DNA polymerase V family protein [unclassified Haladaptatus]|uniref:DNA polymerase V family protein n=1 Tax=unclassified Haladaptatus TaxID=2622732 RepID=UPI00209C325A|nr:MULTISPECIES: DNA polymerase V family protein [unclassified Haladaptatus]MCO8243941.1 DNA polymerase V family protein [Haladaptatus sp. AB643]MCO8256476.1 DNA polymerase V family protein [Haladaptatus sp. AB618]
MTEENTVRKLVEGDMGKELNAERVVNALTEMEGENGQAIGRDLGRVVGCGLGMLVGRRVGASLGDRLEHRLEAPEASEEESEAEPTREQLVLQRVQEVLEVSKEDAQDILATASSIGMESADGESESSEEDEQPAETADDEAGADKSEEDGSKESQSKDESGEQEVTDDSGDESEAEDDSDAEGEPTVELDQLSNDDLQVLANDLMEELDRRKAAQ